MQIVCVYRFSSSTYRLNKQSLYLCLFVCLFWVFIVASSVLMPLLFALFAITFIIVFNFIQFYLISFNLCVFSYFAYKHANAQIHRQPIFRVKINQQQRKGDARKRDEAATETKSEKANCEDKV